MMRTEQILGTEIKIPGDIPYMVQKVYDQKNDLELTGEMYKTAKEIYKCPKDKEARRKKIFVGQTLPEGNQQYA